MNLPLDHQEEIPSRQHAGPVPVVAGPPGEKRNPGLFIGFFMILQPIHNFIPRRTKGA